jgi:general secretion pathway protein E
MTLHRAVGCASCGGTGYVGRSAILEILPFTETIRQLVLKRSDTSKIAAAAIDEGMVPMRDDGLQKVVAGQTTLEEVLRVTPDQL